MLWKQLLVIVNGWNMTKFEKFVIFLSFRVKNPKLLEQVVHHPLLMEPPPSQPPTHLVAKWGENPIKGVQKMLYKC